MTQQLRELAEDIWDDYTDLFWERWGVDDELAVRIGQLGDVIFEAEFREHGVKSYHTSIVQTIRNAYYSSMVMPHRWEKLIRWGKLEEPIVDYGAGCGFLLRFLQHYGYEDLRFVEVGANRQVCKSLGYKQWDEEKEVGTIICLNVLEHFTGPVTMLGGLQRKAKQIIANCDESEQVPHIASMAARKRCNEILRENGQHFEFAPEHA